MKTLQKEYCHLPLLLLQPYALSFFAPRDFCSRFVFFVVVVDFTLECVSSVVVAYILVDFVCPSSHIYTTITLLLWHQFPKNLDAKCFR